MKIIVIGAGAWGLPTALQLQDRGHRVTLIERFTAGNPYASSAGDTRIWRLADTQLWRARALAGTVPAMERLSDRLNTPVFERTGLLWRDDISLASVSAALDSINAEYTEYDAADVDAAVPGLRSDERDALFVPESGVVYADTLLQRGLDAFIAAGGSYLPRTRVKRVEADGSGAVVYIEGAASLAADQLLITAGPGTPDLLPGLNLRLPLRPYIEQVVYFGDASLTPPAPVHPAFIDGPNGDTPGIYAMPAGPNGYKIGLDKPLRHLSSDTLDDDLDRAIDPVRTEVLRARVERDLTQLPTQVLSEQVCTWTDSGDGDFIVARVNPSVVLACGDSGEGFKFSAFMGEYLANLIEGESGDPEFQRYWRADRFGSVTDPRDTFGAIGRH